jgi:hypothetical protein
VKLGPPLNGVDARKSGTYEGFNYSPANKNSGITWDHDAFAKYIRAPMQEMPGTRMAFVGIKNDNATRAASAQGLRRIARCNAGLPSIWRVTAGHEEAKPCSKDVGTSPTLGRAESALSVLSLPVGTRREPGSGSVLVPFDLLDQIDNSTP